MPGKTKYSRTIVRNAEARQSEIEDHLESGAGITQIANRMKVNVQGLRRWMDVLGLKPNRHDARKNVSKKYDTDRILELRRGGATLQSIGDEFGFSREYARQIIAAVAPDVVFPSRRTPADVKLCSQCDSEFSGKGYHRGQCCSRSCSSALRGTQWSRNDAERLMELRDQGKTWDEVSHSMKRGKSGVVLRANIQRQIGVLFNTKEQKKYFNR